MLSPPTEGECNALVAWHIERGHFGDVTLDGLNIALALHSPGHMKDGHWTVALYLDERADSRQQDALKAIFSGQAGGHPGHLAEFIGEVKGIERVPLDYAAEGKAHRLRIGRVGRADIRTVEGQNGSDITVENHPLAVAPGYPVTVARSEELRYRDHGFDWQLNDRSGLFSPFTYHGTA
jgi:hypothetical protein